MQSHICLNMWTPSPPESPTLTKVPKSLSQIAATLRKLALHPLSDHIAYDDVLEEVVADTSSEIITMESSYRDRDVGLSIIAGDVLQTYFIIQKKEEV